MTDHDGRRRIRRSLIAVAVGAGALVCACLLAAGALERMAISGYGDPGLLSNALRLPQFLNATGLVLILYWLCSLAYGALKAVLSIRRGPQEILDRLEAIEDTRGQSR